MLTDELCVSGSTHHGPPVWFRLAVRTWSCTFLTSALYKSETHAVCHGYGVYLEVDDAAVLLVVTTFVRLHGEEAPRPVPVRLSFTVSAGAARHHTQTHYLGVSLKLRPSIWYNVSQTNIFTFI